MKRYSTCLLKNVYYFIANIVHCTQINDIVLNVGGNKFNSERKLNTLIPDKTDIYFLYLYEYYDNKYVYTVIHLVEAFNTN